MGLREGLEYAIGAGRREVEHATNRVNDMMDPKVISVDEEKQKYVVEFKLQDWMLNQRTELHGGICSTAFDIASGMGAFILSGKKSVATVDMYVNFISRMPGNEDLEIEVRLIKSGRSFIRFCADAYSKQTSKLIATSMVTYAILQPDTLNKK